MEPVFNAILSFPSETNLVKASSRSESLYGYLVELKNQNPRRFLKGRYGEPAFAKEWLSVARCTETLGHLKRDSSLNLYVQELTQMLILIGSISAQVILQSLPHDSNCYTQGLKRLPDGFLVESCGLYGSSKLLKYLPGSSQRRELKFENKIFLEGLTLVKGMIWLITWKERLLIKVEPQNLKEVQRVNISHLGRQGWGLQYDEKRGLLYMTNGSQHLIVFDENLKLIQTKDLKIPMVNQLQLVGDVLWGNIYLTDKVIAFNLTSQEGTVLKMQNLSSWNRAVQGLVLNGIAVANESTFWMTGKQWPHIHRVKI